MLQTTESISAPAVVVRNVSKVYPGEGLGRKRREGSVRALEKVSLVVEKGDSVGLLGQNGSGKSTLLRIIAGAESASEGDVLVSAKPTLMGVSAALVPYLSGSRNIELGCLAMGMTPQQVRDAYPEIVKLADIGDAIDRPMNTYSSGMGARLKFAIGTSADPELLLIDEALSTGDSAFRGRAEERMNSLLESAGTLFMVSHAPRAIEDMCSRAVWVHHGEIIADTEAWIACEQYTKWTGYRAKGKDTRAEEFIEEVKDWYVRPEIVFDSEIG